LKIRAGAVKSSQGLLFHLLSIRTIDGLRISKGFPLPTLSFPLQQEYQLFREISHQDDYDDISDGAPLFYAEFEMTKDL
jgi:hypothetical protein